MTDCSYADVAVCWDPSWFSLEKKKKLKQFFITTVIFFLSVSIKKTLTYSRIGPLLMSVQQPLEN